MGGEGREGMRLGGEVEERRSVGEDIPLHMYLLTFFLLSRKNLISFPLRQFSTTDGKQMLHVRVDGLLTPNTSHDMELLTTFTALSPILKQSFANVNERGG